MQKISLDRSPAFRILVEEFPQYFTHGTGRALVLGKWKEEGLSVFSFGEKGDISIMYRETSDLFRALGLLMAEFEKGNTGIIKIRQTAPFKFRGLMIDASRNAVMKTEAVKKSIVKLALLGYNALCMYTEDTYEVEGEPLIGYLRGKYTMKEMKELDDFSFKFGIEMFPCIQALGHMAHIFKFNKYFEYRDDDRCFNVRNEKIYKLIEKMIKSASKPFRSKRIHVCMDEAHGVGLGNAFLPGKVNDPRELHVKHMKRVTAICSKLGLKMLMWGDSIVGFCAGTKPFTPAQRKALPKDLTVVYWDYYKTTAKEYDDYIVQYEKMGFKPMIAPGIWNWLRFWPVYPKAENNLDLFMPVAVKHGLDESLITAWGDDGNECPFNANWPALALHAEYCWKEKVDKKAMKTLVKAISGNSFESLTEPWILDAFNKKDMLAASSIGRAFLYEDPMIGVFSGHTQQKRFGPYYEKAYRRIKNLTAKEKANKDIIGFALAFANVLRLKADFQKRAYAAYNKGNKAELRRLLTDADELKRRVKNLWELHRKNWLAERKVTGLDVMDLRYSGLLGRLDIFKLRVGGYLAGKIPSISEFEEKREACFGKFPYCGSKMQRDLSSFHMPV